MSSSRGRLRTVEPHVGADTPASSFARQEARLARQVEQAHDSELAARVKTLLAAGNAAEAREVFSTLVGRQQRRASRIAYHFLRDVGETDEAVQEAFIRVFTHMASYQEDLPFEVWFTRILVNACLDRRKASRRRGRWLIPSEEAFGDDRERFVAAASPGPSPEDVLVSRERRRAIERAVAVLPERQRTVVTLCLYDERSPREVSMMTGMNQSTVRVHLFRALRRLRALLEDSRDSRR